MKYMMLIYQGTTRRRRRRSGDRLPEDEKKAVYGAYKGINETPGVTPASRCSPPKPRPRSVQDGRR